MLFRQDQGKVFWFPILEQDGQAEEGCRGREKTHSEGRKESGRPPNYLYDHFLLLAVLGIESRALHVLVKRSIIGLSPALFLLLL